MIRKASIIIPCHNAAAWLGATLESAVAQTYAHTEIIVVDDGSSDNSHQIAAQFIDRGVRVVAQSNCGAAAARNHGLRLATGDMVQFLDADDLLAPNKIAEQVTLIGPRTDVIASCRWGRFEHAIKDTVFADDDLAHDFDPIEFLLLHTGQARMMHPAAWLVPRAIIDQVGPWDEELSLNDDGEYFARIMLRSRRMVAATSTCTYYRSGISSSLSRRRSPAAFRSLERSVERVTAHLLQAENTPRVRAALAEYWQRLEYEIYPFAPDICRRARHEAQALGGASNAPAAGYREHLAARLLGWRLARRLRLLLVRPGL
jgi:glycosyltransferase involved in cell wall biosynthesis